MRVKIELPLTAIEPLFTALHSMNPTKHTRLENKAVSLLRTALVFELEKMMETPDEEELRQINFKRLFNEQRERRERHIQNEKEHSNTTG